MESVEKEPAEEKGAKAKAPRVAAEAAEMVANAPGISEMAVEAPGTPEAPKMAVDAPEMEAEAPKMVAEEPGMAPGMAPEAPK